MSTSRFIPSLCLAILAAITLTVSGVEPFREWTQEASGRTLNAKLVDKMDDDSKAKVVTPNGRVHWLVTADLIEEDQEYIAEWMPEIDHLTVRVTGSAKGRKTVTVNVVAGREALVLTIGRIWPDQGRTSRKVLAGESKEFTFTVHPDYKARVDTEEGDLIDEENWNKKTGL